MQVGCPHGHESASDGKTAFNQATDGLWDGWGDSGKGDEGIAGGQVKAVFTLDSGGG